MTYKVEPVTGETGKWIVSVDFSDEDADNTAQNEVRGTQEQAESYATTLARDFRENHAELFPPPPVVEHDPIMEEML